MDAALNPHRQKLEYPVHDHKLHVRLGAMPENAHCSAFDWRSRATVLNGQAHFSQVRISLFAFAI
jgi:hypothetical protein